ncbi:hypothetical protein EJB05_31973 [Eragrostis curvula]|uniref:Aminotransferase-like plant mobile domain-containing protein n=1 Tax=Eragrostis curvula TaxID=38414 RepID=A0A5J9UGJ0_9POAL|nr:hypothetical protein EJB05_31973 [Eragrostis curvula]
METTDMLGVPRWSYARRSVDSMTRTLHQDEASGPMRLDLRMADGGGGGITSADTGQNIAGDSGDPCGADGMAVTSRCAARIAHEVITNLSDDKRRIVKSIGFGGLLEFPAMKQVDRKFSMWLMSKVDVESHTLVLSERRKISFNKEDVSLVFGVSCAGSEVVPRQTARWAAPTTCSSGIVGGLRKDLRSVKAVQDVLERNYADGMTREEEDEFKVAFVVFVMSCILAPCSKHDYASADYWRALADPSRIHEYNWASYVLQRLMDAVRKLKADIKKRVRSTNLTGCSLFLQVLYLDSMDMGAWNMSHEELPRIKCFPSERLRIMISLDRVTGNCGPATSGFGAHKAAADLLFAIAAEIWKKRGRAMLAKVSPLIAAETIMEVVCDNSTYSTSDACGGDDETDSNARVRKPRLADDKDELGCSSGSKRKIQAQMQSCSKMTVCGGSSWDATKVTTRRSTEGIRVYAALRSEAADYEFVKAMAIYHMASRHTRQNMRIDLNVSVEDGETHEEASKQVVRKVQEPMTPWQFGFHPRESGRNCMDVIQDMERRGKDANSETAWVVHTSPNYVEVRARSLIEQATGACDLDMDTMDANIRRLRQIDDDMYAAQGGSRWRHFMESEFTIFFPTIVGYRWVCYAWDMKCNVVHICDPGCNQSMSSEVGAVHATVVDMIKVAMADVARRYFDGWSHDWSAAKMRMHELSVENMRSTRTGWIVAYFCRNFDGKNVLRYPPGPHVDAELATGDTLADLMEIEGNIGRLPGHTAT